MKKLSEETECLKRAILDRHDFSEDEAGLELLNSGLRALDIEAECLAVIEADGLLVKGDRGQVKAHPLCAVARDARAQFFAAVKMLKLIEFDEEARPVGRPTAWDSHLKSNRGNRL